MSEVIFEIGCEEIPARFIPSALEQLRAMFLEHCAEARLEVSEASVRAWGTPRRLVLTASRVADTQANLEEERTGPPVKAAYRDGEPTSAALGFARGQGVDVSDLYTVETQKGAYVAAKVFEEGAPTSTLLPDILDAMLRGLSFPKSMRWATYADTFPRPVRWLLALFDGEVVDVEYANVRASNRTYGHRFAAPGAILVETIQQYRDDLRSAHVWVEPEERREEIKRRLHQCAEEIGGTVREDPSLLDEVVFLVEAPHVLVVEFDEKYLELPREVLISSMRKHQRYFSVLEPGGDALMNACIVVYNTPVRDPNVVRAGNLRVLKARLDDARFFFEQDTRDGTTLHDWSRKLDSVVWLYELGSQGERTERLEDLSEALAKELELGDVTVAHARRAASLAKADLVTNMVGEFPDLQGIIGREYALAAGQPEQVAHAIAEQYLPSGADDPLPATDAGAVVAMATRLDTLVGIWGAGKLPKGNKDPYQLRRAAIGLLRIVRERAYSVTLKRLLGLAFEEYARQDKLEAFPGERDQLLPQIEEFVLDRLRGLLEHDAPRDIVNAVLDSDGDDLLSMSDRARALVEVREEEGFDELAEIFKRVVNILPDDDRELDELGIVDPELLQQDAERALLDAYDAATKEVAKAVSARDWVAACRTLAGLRAPITRFFDDVMVHAEDPNIKRNRLALLAGLRREFRRVANIALIQSA
ncbi:MAG: glycine--tRNA ligase subunit beta [Myxococcota bacterium]